MTLSAPKLILFSVGVLHLALNSGRAFGSEEISNPPSPWQDMPGKCFNSIDEYMYSTYPWTRDGEDENISLKQTENSSGKFTLVTDSTTSTNVTRTLLKETHNKQCIILYVPISSTVSSIFSNSTLAEEIKSQDTAGPDGISTEVNFKRDLNGYYRPVECFSLKDESRKSIPCRNVFIGF